MKNAEIILPNGNFSEPIKKKLNKESVSSIKILHFIFTLPKGENIQIFARGNFPFISIINFSNFDLGLAFDIAILNQKLTFIVYKNDSIMPNSHLNIFHSPKITPNTFFAYLKRLLPNK